MIDLDRLFSTLPLRRDANTFTDEKLHQQAISKAKSRYSVFPSAYASSYLVQEYKRLYKEKYGRTKGAFKKRSDSDRSNNFTDNLNTDDLKKWYRQNWKAIDGSGNIVGECGSGKTKGKVKCLPESKARALSQSERSKLAKRKQRKDPKKERSGKPIMVSSSLDNRDDENKLYFFAGRRTGIIASSAETARKKKKRGGKKIVKVRSLTASEEKQAHSGGWVRSGPNGEAPGALKTRGYGPRPKAYKG